MTSYEIKAIL